MQWLQRISYICGFVICAYSGFVEPPIGPFWYDTFYYVFGVPIVAVYASFFVYHAVVFMDKVMGILADPLPLELDELPSLFETGRFAWLWKSA